MEILKVTDLKKTYTSRFGGNQVQALKGVSLTVESKLGEGSCST